MSNIVINSAASTSRCMAVKKFLKAFNSFHS